MLELSSIQKRFLYFLLGCIPTRIGIGYIVQYSENYKYLQLIVGGILSIIAIGFLSIYLFGLREKGAETQGQPIWWNSIRPIHSILYGVVGYLLLSSFIGHKNIFSVSDKKIFILGRNIIIADAIFGLISFIIYHVMNGNIYKIL
jgi:hypothetical protein